MTAEELLRRLLAEFASLEAKVDELSLALPGTDEIADEVVERILYYQAHAPGSPSSGPERRGRRSASTPARRGAGRTPVAK